MSKKKTETAHPEQAGPGGAEDGENAPHAAFASEESGAPDFPGAEQAGAQQAGTQAGARAGAQDDAVTRLEAEVAEQKDRLLRALAEIENVRRRAERDRQEAAEYGGSKLAKDLLPVYDNLERALGHADEVAREKAGAVIEGIELTRRELLNAFAKNRIEKFAPEQGEKFDPHFQQAMYEAPVPGARPGTVIEVIQAGFTIAGRLLRPALVGVAKAQPAQEPPQAGAEGDAEGDGEGNGEADAEGDAEGDAEANTGRRA